MLSWRKEMLTVKCSRWKFSTVSLPAVWPFQLEEMEIDEEDEAEESEGRPPSIYEPSEGPCMDGFLMMRGTISPLTLYRQFHLLLAWTLNLGEITHKFKVRSTPCVDRFRSIFGDFQMFSPVTVHCSCLPRQGNQWKVHGSRKARTWLHAFTPKNDQS